LAANVPAAKSVILCTTTHFLFHVCKIKNEIALLVYYLSFHVSVSVQNFLIKRKFKQWLLTRFSTVHIYVVIHF
jgi:hypothetical protein